MERYDTDGDGGLDDIELLILWDDLENWDILLGDESVEMEDVRRWLQVHDLNKDKQLSLEELYAAL